MPFDGCMKMPSDKEPPDLADLAQLLRQPERWPRDFKWNYRIRANCAMGLCELVYGRGTMLIVAPDVYDWGTATNRIFLHMRVKTTASAVADAIDAHLGKRRAGGLDDILELAMALSVFALFLVAV